MIGIGKGQRSLNILDPGGLLRVAATLETAGAPEHVVEQVRADASVRRLSLIKGLVAINRGRPLNEVEVTALARALDLVDQRFPTPGSATLHDLIAVIEEGPAELQVIAMARDSESAYHAAMDGLEGSLRALTEGTLGATFAGEAEEAEIDLSRPTCINISEVPRQDKITLAAILLASWTWGYAAMEGAQQLAAAGLGERRRVFVIVDELWRVLRARGMVEVIDEVTRLNRTDGYIAAFISHSTGDTRVGDTVEEEEAAKGFIERSGMLILGAVNSREVELVRRVAGVEVSQAEEKLVGRWTAPAGFDAAGRKKTPPGMGKFLIKVGNRPGIEVQVELTEAEKQVYSTNDAWEGAQS